ncbi:MAG TPA: hypothetical protein VGK74_10540 [Symbiobacteriaceae bacterium]|jgi:hypothetical protein
MSPVPASHDELLALADIEIRQLRGELAIARGSLEKYRELLENLAGENADLYRRLLPLMPPPPTPPLSGLRIGIIGHPGREADYREVIERLGGYLLFAEARDKLSLVYRVVQKAHGTLYLTAWGSHKAHQRAADAARRHDRPLVLSDRPGLVTVERVVVDELLPLIRRAPDP